MKKNRGIRNTTPKVDLQWTKTPEKHNKVWQWTEGKVEQKSNEVLNLLSGEGKIDLRWVSEESKDI